MSLGRNELCSCGSLKKYKKCCLPKKEQHHSELYLKSQELTGENLKEYLHSLGLIPETLSEEDTTLQKEMEEDWKLGEQYLKEHKENYKKNLTPLS